MEIFNFLNNISPLISGLDFIIGIFVVIKLFKREGTLKGILGLICMLYTFIWGWIHIKDENLYVWMYIWTAISIVLLIVVGLTLYFAASAIQQSTFILQPVF